MNILWKPRIPFVLDNVDAADSGVGRRRQRTSSRFISQGGSPIRNPVPRPSRASLQDSKTRSVIDLPRERLGSQSMRRDCSFLQGFSLKWPAGPADPWSTLALPQGYQTSQRAEFGGRPAAFLRASASFSFSLRSPCGSVLAGGPTFAPNRVYGQITILSQSEPFSGTISFAGLSPSNRVRSNGAHSWAFLKSLGGCGRIHRPICTVVI